MTREGHLQRTSGSWPGVDRSHDDSSPGVRAYTLTPVFFSGKYAATSDILPSVFAICRKAWPAGFLFRSRIPAELPHNPNSPHPLRVCPDFPSPAAR